MMPSRGLQAVKGHAPRIYQLQCRNLSSAASRRRPPPSCHSALSLSPRAIPWGRISSIAASTSYQALRHASTSPTSVPSTATSPPISPPTESIPFPNLDTITLDTADFASIPEKIGYLHEIGLNYGWGPTSMIEWVLEHIHIYSGLPWWGSIASTAVLIRLCMFPLYLKSSDAMARQQALSVVTKPISDRMTQARQSGNQAEVMMAYQQLMALRKRAGLRFRDQFAPLIVQGILGYCGFKLMRAMANLPVPALTTDGPLWIQDLTVSDPYLILPVAMAGSIHLLVRMGGESGSMDSSQMTQTMRNVSLWVMPGAILFMTGWLPATVNVWFAGGGAFAICQSLLLQRPAVRQFFGIAPLYRPGKDEVDKGFIQGMLEQKMNETTKKSPNPPNTSTNSTKPFQAEWQAPNLRYYPSSQSASDQGQVIDTTLTTKVETSSSPTDVREPEMVQPTAPTAEKASSIIQEARQRIQSKPQAPEEKAKQDKASFKRAAAAYENRAQNRRRRR